MRQAKKKFELDLHPVEILQNGDRWQAKVEALGYFTFGNTKREVMDRAIAEIMKSKPI